MACSLLGNTLIYNSRNCYGFIAIIYDKRKAMGIYNSRNCYGFIAENERGGMYDGSTIVEIVMAL